MFVCMCRAVTEAQIRTCIRAGATTLEELSERSRAGTGCGGCLDSVEMILEDGEAFAAAELGSLPQSA